MTLEDWSDFDADAVAESVALSAGIDADSVIVESVDYTVSSTWVFPPDTDIKENECVASVAAALLLAESGVICKVLPPQRRLTAFLGGGRNLQEGVQVQVVISTADLEVAKRVQKSATDTAAISSKMSETTGTRIEEPIISVAPSVGVKVTTKIVSTDAAVSAPSAEELASAYEKGTGEAVKMSVEVLTSATTTVVPNGEAFEDVPNRAPQKTIFSTVVLPIAMLIVMPLWSDRA